MDGIVRKIASRHSMILGGALLLGVLEFVALQRSQRMARLQDTAGSNH